ncbi:hypothetical protein TrLO_g4201 [Triparma laevis f. longispina]|uniref:Uncharacterized protein n=1 Tax=Triparma laevis f. longispina TaxID=1714387 RepID=A0A9W7FK44_9STRA|nr:hypothetical protein TrLO_g4201 [Triparma laevis f. longispina]
MHPPALSYSQLHNIKHALLHPRIFLLLLVAQPTLGRNLKKKGGNDNDMDMSSDDEMKMKDKKKMKKDKKMKHEKKPSSDEPPLSPTLIFDWDFRGCDVGQILVDKVGGIIATPMGPDSPLCLKQLIGLLKRTGS